MPPLPTEVLQHICEYSGEIVPSWPSHSSLGGAATHNPPSPHFLSLLAFSAASRAFRQVSTPYLFRRLRVKTIEGATAIVQSSLLKHVRHLNFPAVDILTSRRPLTSPLRVLVAQAKSIRIGATSPTFFLTAQTPLSRLLSSATLIDTLELYCEPILQNVDAATLVADLLPVLPKSLTRLRITVPGGQPEHAGVETLLGALSSLNSGTSQALPELKGICLSMHLSPFYASKPEKLAIAIARRVPSLRYMTVVAPGRNKRREANVWELVGPRDGSEIWGGYRQEVMSWEFQRDIKQADKGAQDKVNTSYEVISGDEHWVDARLYD